MWCPVDWLPEDHSCWVRSLWNRRWWQGGDCGKKVQRFFYPCSVSYRRRVMGVWRLMSSKCCNWAQKREIEILRNSWWPFFCSYSPSLMSVWGKDTTEDFHKDIYVQLLRALNVSVAPTFYHNKNGWVYSHPPPTQSVDSSLHHTAPHTWHCGHMQNIFLFSLELMVLNIQ